MHVTSPPLSTGVRGLCPQPEASLGKTPLPGAVRLLAALGPWGRRNEGPTPMLLPGWGPRQHPEAAAGPGDSPVPSQRAACRDAARCTVSLGRCADSVCRGASVQGHPCRPRPCSSCGRKPGRVLPAGGAAGHAELHAAPASEGPAGIGTCLTASPFLHESHVVCVCSDVCAISVLLPDACIRRSPGPCLRSGRGLLPMRSLPCLLPARSLPRLLPVWSLLLLLPARSLLLLFPVWSLPLLLAARSSPAVPAASSCGETSAFVCTVCCGVRGQRPSAGVGFRAPRRGGSCSPWAGANHGANHGAVR